MVMKPNTSRKTTLRQHAGTIPIGDIRQVAAVIRKAHKKHRRWNGSTKGQMLLTIHSSGAVITKRPIAKAKATLEQVGLVDICDHLRAVMESPTAVTARDTWAPVLPTRGREA